MLRTRKDLMMELLESAHSLLIRHFENITLEEALYIPQNGYRSVVGTLKHAAGWSHVYRSYAFDEDPKHWVEIAWPHGLRDTVIKSDEYLRDMIAWFKESHQLWMKNLLAIEEAQFDELRPLHWGEEAPIFDIVLIIAQHHVYHAGELNQVLSICREEAWEEGEEVEENNISTVGHRARPAWLDP